MIVFVGHKLCGVYVLVDEVMQIGHEVTLLPENVVGITGFGKFMVGRRVCLCKLLQQMYMQRDGVSIPAYSVKFLPTSAPSANHEIGW